MLGTTFSLLASLSTVLAAATPLVNCPGGGVTANAACCALFPVLADLETHMFTDGCGDAAHTALRVVFHDAIGFSTTNATVGGGADGSIFIFAPTELTDPANVGIADAFNLVVPFINKHNIGVADFLHFTGAVSLTKCPGSAPVQFFFGRTDAKAATPIGSVPVPMQSVSEILARMADAGFSPTELVALLASHSIAGADDVDPIKMGLPFDSTPAVFDTQFFVETTLKGTGFPGSPNNPGEAESAIAGELRLQSDANFARAPETACAWQANINNQQHMATSFATAFTKLQNLGQDVNRMVDCSDVLPIPPPLPAANANSFLPVGLTQADLEQSCAITPLPTVASAPAAQATAAMIIQNPLTQNNCLDDGTGCFINDFA